MERLSVISWVSQVSQVGSIRSLHVKLSGGYLANPTNPTNHSEIYQISSNSLVRLVSKCLKLP